MSTHLAKSEHEVAYQDLYRLLKERTCANDLTSREVLAIAANMVGKLVAMQDQRTTTPELALEIVARNIEQGNAEALDVMNQLGGSA